MLSLLHRLLLKLPPEVSHGIAMALLRLWQTWLFKIWHVRWPRPPAIVIKSLPTLKFPSRVGLAAGFDKNAEAFAALARLGFGFIEVGTVTPLPQPGNAKPRIFREPPGSLVNHLGFNSQGLPAFRANVRRYRRYISGVPLFANLGKNKDTPNDRAIDDYFEGVKYLSACVDGFVVNLSSPNTPGLRDLQTESFIEELAKILPAELPAFLKLAPDLDDGDLIRLLEQVGHHSRFSGVVLTNTSRRLAKTLTGREQGGLSGAPLLERALECVSLARQKLPAEKVIIGVGGVTSVAAAKKMRAAGADLVEVYTGFVYQGPPLIRQIADALD